MLLKAILFVIGSMMINLTLGSFYAIGNGVPYIVSYMRKNGTSNVSPEDGTWITAAFLLGQGLFIFVGSKIENISNTRVTCIIGCLLHTLSTLTTKFTLDSSFWMLVIVYGFGSGAGCGLAYIAAIIGANRWFPQSKGLMTGIVVGSFGFGGLVWSPLQTLYMNPRNEQADDSGNFPQSVYEKTPSMFLYIALIFGTLQAIGCILASPGPSIIQETEYETSIGPPPVKVLDDELFPQVTTFVSVFKYKIFYVIGLMMMLVAPGVTFVNSLGKTYGLTYIKDDRYLALVVALAALPNSFGRCIWGYLVERFGFRICYTAKVILFGFLIALFAYSFILSSKVLYAFWMLGLFFGFSASFVLFPVYIEQIFGPKFHGMVYGFLYIFLAISSIITAIIVQFSIGPALRTNKNPTTIRIVSCSTIALLYGISLLIFCALLPVRKLDKAIQRRAEQDMERTKNTLFNRQDLYPLDRNLSKDIFQRDTNSLGSIVRFRDSPNQF